MNLSVFEPQPEGWTGEGEKKRKLLLKLYILKKTLREYPGRLFSGQLMTRGSGPIGASLQFNVSFYFFILS